MMSKDRDKHDDDERTARQASQEISTKISVLTAQVISTNATLSGLERDQQTAEKTRDTELLKKLRPQIATAQAQANDASRNLLLALVPNVLNSLRAQALYWSIEMDLIRDKLRENVQNSHDAAHSTALQEAANNAIADLNVRYSARIKSSMMTANDLRAQLLRLAPPDEPGDSQMGALFTKAASGGTIAWGDLMTAAGYLDALTKRVSSASH